MIPALWYLSLAAAVSIMCWFLGDDVGNDIPFWEAAVSGLVWPILIPYALWCKIVWG